MSAHWSQFWQTTKTLNSFSSSENALGYQGELLAFWHKQFASLTTTATVLDIGTGNGALALAVSRYMAEHQRKAQVHALDAAAIDPCAMFADEPAILSELQKIHFYAECKIEDLPFASASIDLIISQFALEYAEAKAAVAACARVLAPQGRLVAVMHHNASEIALDCIAGIRVLKAFLYESAFQAQAKALMVATLAASEPQQLRLANQLLLTTVKQIEQQLINIAEQEWFHFVMHHLSPLFVNIAPDHLYRFDMLLSQLTASYQRLVDQHDAALSLEQISGWAAEFRKLQLESHFEELKIEDTLFGWVLLINR